jgi:menaquinone-dependent protoporphyrinogen oxidase
MKKILVAYASKAGSTREVAEEIARVIIEKGYEVELLSANKVKSLEGYDGVVFGTAIRIYKPIAEGRRFVKKFGSQLMTMPTAVFSVGLAMKEDNPESRKETEGFLAPITEAVKPFSVAMFGGKLDYAALSPMIRYVFTRDKSGEMAEGDWRDWEGIRDWAVSILDDFS